MKKEYKIVLPVELIEILEEMKKIYPDDTTFNRLLEVFLVDGVKGYLEYYERCFNDKNSEEYKLIEQKAAEKGIDIEKERSRAMAYFLNFCELLNRYAEQDLHKIS